jgi:hypothetical protein
VAELLAALEEGLAPFFAALLEDEIFGNLTY